MDCMEKLNKEQQEAVLQGDGIAKVIAGPGSGKTRIITHRIAHLITAKKADPKSILALTYTRKAAETIRSRLEQLVGDQARQVELRTFHSFCLRLAQKEQTIRSRRILSEQESAELLRDAMDGNEATLDLEDVGRGIKGLKNCLITSEEARVLTPELAGLYGSYERRKKQANAMDYEDMLLDIFNLFSTRHSVRNRYSSRYQYILIDEAQDVSKAQFEIVKLITSPQYNLFVVCDPNQSIYGWRGANGSIERLCQDYPELKEFRLSTTYRHGENIIKPSTNLIRHNHDAVTTDLLPAPATMPGEIKVFESRSQGKETRTLAREILALQRKGVDLSECAVLVRTNRLASFYVKACADFGILTSGHEKVYPAIRQNGRESALTNIARRLLSFAPFRHSKSEIRNLASGRLNILTMHKAKGLEFRHVFIPGLKDGLFPNTERDSDLKEERRVCYVAMTRARESLYLSAVRPASQFLYEIAA